MDSLSKYDGAMLLAREANAWHKSDSALATRLLDNAVDTVTTSLMNESDADHEARINAALEVLKIASAIDQQRAERISSSLRSEADANGQIRNAVGRAALEQAMDGDANVAYRMAQSASTFGPSPQLANMVQVLRSKNPEMADKLFSQLLDSIQAGNFDARTLTILSYDAFPTWSDPSRKGPSAAIVQRFLNVLQNSVLNNPPDSPTHDVVCTVTSQTMRLISHYPEVQASAIRDAARSCSSRFTAEGDQQPCSGLGVQECLKAAELNQDPVSRAAMKQSAANDAEQQDHDPEAALKILKGLSDDEKKAYPGYRSEIDKLSFEIARLYLRSNNDGAFYSFLRGCDDATKVHLLGRLTPDLLQAHDGRALELLSEARQGMSAKDVAPQDVIRIVNIYAKYFPGELSQVLSEAIASLNNIPNDTLTRVGEDPSVLPVVYNMNPPSLSSALLDLDQSFLSASIKTIDSPQLRQTVRLALVTAALRRDEERPKETPTKKPDKATRSLPGESARSLPFWNSAVTLVIPHMFAGHCFRAGVRRLLG